MKSEIELLQEEIKLLKEKYSLLELRFRVACERLDMLERQSNTFKTIGSGTVIDSCLHEYPNPWGATVPPCCKKCGKQATWPFITS